MDYTERLPAIISLSASILLGYISYCSRVETGKIYVILSISLVIFYIAGLIVRSTVRQIQEQLEEEQKQKLEEEKRLAEERRRLEEDINKQNTKDKTEAKPSTIDYSVGDDGFIPFQFGSETVDKDKPASVK